MLKWKLDGLGIGGVWLESYSQRTECSLLGNGRQERRCGAEHFSFEKNALKSVGAAEIHKVRKVRRSQRLAVPTGLLSLNGG